MHCSGISSFARPPFQPDTTTNTTTQATEQSSSATTTDNCPVWQGLFQSRSPPGLLIQVVAGCWGPTLASRPRGRYCYLHMKKCGKFLAAGFMISPEGVPEPSPLLSAARISVSTKGRAVIEAVQSESAMNCCARVCRDTSSSKSERHRTQPDSVASVEPQRYEVLLQMRNSLAAWFLGTRGRGG